MTLKEILGLIAEQQECLIDFCNGIKGMAIDLYAALNDECLSETVDYIEVSEDKAVLIHLK